MSIIDVEFEEEEQKVEMAIAEAAGGAFPRLGPAGK
jgi:hypothetical protein